MHDQSFPIFIVRHGETDWNIIERLQGRRDSPLTLRGREQARLVGVALAAELTGAESYMVYASPQGRVQATLELAQAGFASPPARYVEDQRLVEITYGDWDGMSRAEIEAAHPGMQAYRLRHHWSFVPPRGESYAMVAARVRPVLDDILAEARRQIVLVFTHGAVGRVLRGHYGRMPWRQVVRLEEPQDAFYRLWRGQIEKIEA